MKNVFFHCFLFFFLHTTILFADYSEILKFIKQAGNSEDEVVRLSLLTKALNKTSKVGLKKELNLLIPCIRRWNNNPLMPYFRPNKEFRIKIDKASPIYPILCIYQGRQLVQHTMAASGSWGGGWENIDKARNLFQIAYKAFPKNRIIGMYLGHDIPNTKKYRYAKNAPDWANYQRESLEHLVDVVEWWIDNRQRLDGQFGGGWNDDIEMWRQWAPVLLAFVSPKIIAAQSKLCRGIWKQSYMQKGFCDLEGYNWDVEHSAEFSGDTLPLMMFLEPENADWIKKTKKILYLAQNKWTGINNKGFLQFKSIYLLPDRAENKNSYDTFYHTRVMLPVSLLWMQSGDKEMERFYTKWMDTWVNAAARLEFGKPKGVIPSAIDWPSGRVGGEWQEWWYPGGQAYYAFPSALDYMADTLLLTYYMTKNKKYLSPILSMAKMYLDYTKKPKKGKLKRGIKDWCAKHSGKIVSTIAKYRLLTGDKSFDQLLKKSAYLDFILTGNYDGIISRLKENIVFQRKNFPAYTSELRCTDRMFAYPEVFAHKGKTLFSKSFPSEKIAKYDNSIAYNMAVGGLGGFYFPMISVKWLTPPRDIAALVDSFGVNTFSAQLYHFGKTTRKMGAHFFLLEAGNYEATFYKIINGKKDILKLLKFSITTSQKNIYFTIPSKQLCFFSVRRID